MRMSTTRISFNQYCINHKIISHRAAAAPALKSTVSAPWHNFHVCPSSQQILATPLEMGLYIGNSHVIHGSHRIPMAMGIAKLVLWEGKRKWERVDGKGMKRNLYIFPFTTHRPTQWTIKTWHFIFDYNFG